MSPTNIPAPTSNDPTKTVKTFEQLARQITQLTEEIEELDLFNDPENVHSDQPIVPLEVWQATEHLSCVLERLQNRILSPATRIYQLAGSFIECKVLYVLSKYRVADALQHGPLHLDALATKVNANPEILDRVLRTGIRLGLFKETEIGSKIYANNRISDILRSDHAHCQLGWSTYWPGESYEVWTKYHHALNPEQKRTIFAEHFNTDEPIWVHYEKPENRHMVKVFADAMVSSAELSNFGLVEDYDWSRHKGQTVADIGGGTGSFLQHLLANHPEIRGQLFDREAVIQEAQLTWKSKYSELLDRVTFHHGDFLESVCSGAQVYFTRWIIHDWPDVEAIQILKSIRAVIPENGTLLISDIVIQEDARFSDRIANQMDLMMGAIFWAKERNEKEFSSLLQSAGFKIRKVWAIRSVLSVIEAVTIPLEEN